jgi:hypothetical protein
MVQVLPRSYLSPHIMHACQLTQHLDTGLGLDAASWGTADAAIPCPVIHFHTVNAQGSVLGDLKSWVLQNADISPRGLVPKPIPAPPWRQPQWEESSGVSTEGCSGRERSHP